MTENNTYIELEKLFLEFVEKNKLFQKDDKILLGISGGIDSVVMLHLLVKCEFNVAIAHCNFSLRGEESDMDEAFVIDLARHYNVPIYKTRFDTRSYAKEKGISIQMAARELRFNWFEQIRAINQMDYIALAQHIDDEAETFFINLIRGTGIAGLHGIKPKFKRIIRPLMFANRNDILKYALQHKIKFREDSSNKSNKYLRNKLRLDVLPLFDNIRPGFNDVIHDNIQRIQFVELLYRRYIKKLKRRFVETSEKKAVIHFETFKNNKYKESILFELLKPYHFTNQVCHDISETIEKDFHSGKYFYSNIYTALIDRNTIIVTPRLNEVPNEEIFINTDIKSISIYDKTLSIEITEYNEGILKNHLKNIAFINLDKCQFPLKVRNWKEGDYFYPLGMGMKRKKISDFFIDRKFSINEKNEAWLLLDFRDRIIWIIGHHLDERFKVNDKTEKIGKMTFY